MKGFMMSLEVAEKFFQRCEEQKATTLDHRNRIMHELLHEEDIKIIKDEEALSKVLGQKKVLVVKKGLSE